MSKIDVNLEREFNHSAQSVWSVLRDFGNISWALAGVQVDVTGEGPGMVRTLHLPGIGPVEEKLAVLDNEAMAFRYVIPGKMPFPVTEFVADVKISELSDNRCSVTWKTSAQAIDGSDGSEIEKHLLAGYVDLLKKLEDLLS